MRSIPKVISGLDDVMPGSLAAITRLYTPVFEKLVQVSRPEVAEMMKLYENCQRMMCIAFANEMADACGQHGIDPFEVSRAAATKPFGYMPFMPSLGVGGHCIPVNPYYLLSNSDFPLLKTATEKMWARPSEIARRALDAVMPISNGSESLARGVLPRILVAGVGFKYGQSVLSNSPGLELVKALQMSQKVEVTFADALVKQNAIPQVPRLDDNDWNKETLETFDMIIVSFKQMGMDFSILETLSGVKVEMWCE
jgi:nucleotide sugar dehydrogenase